MFRKTIISLLLYSTFLFAQNNLGIVKREKAEIESFRNNFQLLSSVNGENSQLRSHTIGNGVGQFFFGAITGAVCAIGPLAITMASANHGGNNAAFPGIIISLSAYVFGNGLGVYAISHIENDNLPFWSTIGYSFIGLGAAVISYPIIGKQMNDPQKLLIAMICPIVSAMIYTNLIAGWDTPAPKEEVTQKIVSHKDLYEWGKLINFEVVRIAL